MKSRTEEFMTKAIRFSICHDDEDVAWAFLYLIFNEQHKDPYGLIEDVFVMESERGRGFAKQMLGELIAKAKELHCYKLVASSRYGRNRVHDLYVGLGFVDHGKEFRMDLL